MVTLEEIMVKLEVMDQRIRKINTRTRRIKTKTDTLPDEPASQSLLENEIRSPVDTG